MYQTLKIAFDNISKYVNVRHKYSAASYFQLSSCDLGVWKCGQTQSFMFITSKSLGLCCFKGADESLPI